jgi:hypothetical protein
VEIETDKGVEPYDKERIARSCARERQVEGVKCSSSQTPSLEPSCTGKI